MNWLNGLPISDEPTLGAVFKSSEDVFMVPDRVMPKEDDIIDIVRLCIDCLVKILLNGNLLNFNIFYSLIFLS